jgi:hypothetical protein
MNHTVDASHVNATCSDIGCDKGHAFSVLEPLHCSVTASLCETTVEGLNFQTIVNEVVSDTVNAGTGAAEHDCSSAFTDQFCRDVWFL